MSRLTIQLQRYSNRLLFPTRSPRSSLPSLLSARKASSSVPLHCQFTWAGSISSHSPASRSACVRCSLCSLLSPRLPRPRSPRTSGPRCSVYVPLRIASSSASRSSTLGRLVPCSPRAPGLADRRRPACLDPLNPIPLPAVLPFFLYHSESLAAVRALTSDSMAYRMSSRAPSRSPTGRSSSSTFLTGTRSRFGLNKRSVGSRPPRPLCFFSPSSAPSVSFSGNGKSLRGTGFAARSSSGSSLLGSYGSNPVFASKLIATLASRAS